MPQAKDAVLGPVPAEATCIGSQYISKGEREEWRVYEEEAGKGWSVGAEEGRSRGEGKEKVAVSMRKRDGEGQDAVSVRNDDG